MTKRRKPSGLETAIPRNARRVNVSSAHPWVRSGLGGLHASVVARRRRNCPIHLHGGAVPFCRPGVLAYPVPALGAADAAESRILVGSWSELLPPRKGGRRKNEGAEAKHRWMKDESTAISPLGDHDALISLSLTTPVASCQELSALRR